MVKFLKFTLNIKIYEEFEKFLFKLVWRNFVRVQVYLFATSPLVPR